MYTIYSTEGIILRSFHGGEADKSYLILTKDLGLISADARGVRKIQSKLRYSLQDFSVVDLSLVRGRARWRIANSALVRNVWSDLKGETEARSILGRVGALVTRLIHGEEKNEILYENFKNGALFLANAKLQGDLLKNTEYLLALRTLHALGYLGDQPAWSVFTDTPLFETDLLVKIDSAKREVLSTINNSLRETHL